ncbi:MAG: HAD-IB family hydrolase [Candidatus Pacebacteria bacterium]|nr:HAD-IB family hydrolase [Candidatus Paceibacterota bacterium]
MNQTKKVRLAIFDFDGTLIDGHLWTALLKHNFKKKRRIFSSIWYLVYHMLLYYFYKLKIISQKKCFQAWAKDIPKILVKGLSVEKGKDILKTIWREYLLPTIKKETLSRLKWHQKRGDITILASNAPQDFLEIVKKYLNFNFVVGSILEVKNNRFTGKIIPPLPWSKGKVKRIKGIIKKEKLNVDFKESFSYSDDIRDLPMLKMAGNPVVVSPDEKLLKIAKENHWGIIK